MHRIIEWVQYYLPSLLESLWVLLYFLAGGFFGVVIMKLMLDVFAIEEVLCLL